mgnify:CR=1
MRNVTRGGEAPKPRAREAQNLKQGLKAPAVREYREQLGAFETHKVRNVPCHRLRAAT